ncbi:MAG TPA: HD domain-containing protein [Firmicutes bacterium]|nr:HD domain-containing protein [Bacillota bacterium]HHY97544.1 HD domain-containing protein [Bacillota bacterium]
MAIEEAKRDVHGRADIEVQDRAGEECCSGDGAFLQCDEKLFSDLVAALSMVMDVEEERKLYHGWRVAALTGFASRAVAHDSEELLPIAFYAALLHDIGAAGLSDHMIHYPTLASQLAVPEIIAHPARGAEIILELPGMEAASRMILEHHEYWNGIGYPAGKAGDEISLGAQIIRAADVFDLIVREKISGDPRDLRSEVLRRFEARSGEELSPLVVRAIADIVSSDSDGRFSALVNPEGLQDLVNQMRHQMPSIEPTCRRGPLKTILTIFAKIIDAKHQYTAGHSERVARYSLIIGMQMGLKERELQLLEASALLHDTGKVSVPRSVLDKKGSLAAEEISLIRRHASLTIEILSLITRFEDVAWIAGHHHERYDGKGYPHGLKGDEIPLCSRIIAVADAYDAMTSTRPYQKTLSPSEAVGILLKESGRQFDPSVVDAAVHSLPSL